MPDHPPARRRLTARCLYITVPPDDPRLDGHACRAWEEPGLITIYCSDVDMTPELAEAMTARLAQALAEARFVQVWDGGEPRWRDLEPRHWTYSTWEWARCERRPAAQLPDGHCQYLGGADGGVIWIAAEEEMTARMADYWNAYLSLLLGDGLWEPGRGGAAS